MRKRQRVILKMMACLGDDYFDRNSDQKEEVKDDNRENEVTRQLERITESPDFIETVPAGDEDTTQTVPATRNSL
jgi:hypothetical protein